MKITIDGLNLFQWCAEHNKNYQNTRNSILKILNIKGEKPTKKTTKKGYEERVYDTRVRNRLRKGYSKEESELSKEEFYKLRSEKRGLHFIGKYNLGYVCRKLGIPYKTVFVSCITRKRMTPREYLESKGYNLAQFEEYEK